MTKRRIAFYGGTFDPVHVGHLDAAISVVDLFDLDRLYFLPAFHAPHKPDSKPTSAFHRFAMLTIATANLDQIYVSDRETASGEKRYSIDTVTELTESFPNDKLFFVMGADSWNDILTWRRWEELLLSIDHIVVSRPGYEMRTDHVSAEVAERIVDLRDIDESDIRDRVPKASDERRIFLTDAAANDVSATAIRDDISEDSQLDDRDAVTLEVAKYIEKYELYR